MQYTFQPNIKTVGNVSERFTTEQISTEQMIFSGDWNYTLENAGPITRHVMGVLANTKEFRRAIAEGKNIVIDTRTNMLMEGMYPSIPGWHCDDNIRGENGQPDPRLNTDDVQHFMCLLSDSEEPLARTSFVTEPFTVDLDEEDVWHSLDAAVNEQKPRVGFLSEGDIIRFSQSAIHEATLCKNKGWRFFFRASVTHRKPVNELRKQVQVYVTRNGW